MIDNKKIMAQNSNHKNTRQCKMSQIALKQRKFKEFCDLIFCFPDTAEENFSHEFNYKKN